MLGELGLAPDLNTFAQGSAVVLHGKGSVVLASCRTYTARVHALLGMMTLQRQAFRLPVFPACIFSFFHLHASLLSPLSLFCYIAAFSRRSGARREARRARGRAGREPGRHHQQRSRQRCVCMRCNVMIHDDAGEMLMANFAFLRKYATCSSSTRLLAVSVVWLPGCDVIPPFSQRHWEGSAPALRGSRGGGGSITGSSLTYILQLQ